MNYIKCFESYLSDDLYRKISKEFGFGESLVGAVFDVAEESFNDKKMLIPIDDYYIVTSFDGTPMLDKNGEILKAKMPAKQLAILRVYWKYKLLNSPNLIDNKYLQKILST